LKKKGQVAETDIALSGIEDTKVLMTSCEDNTSQDKSWILDSDSTVHVYSQKELLNSLVVKEEGLSRW